MGALRSPSHFHFLLLLFSLCLFPLPSRSQRQPPAAAAPAPAPAAEVCNGVFLSYSLQTRTKIHPFLTNPSNQPYAFTATATVLNSGTSDVRSWALLVGFSHREIIVSAAGAVLTNGSDLPYATPQDAPTSFSGFPNPDLLTPIATAGDITQIEATINLVGTLFGSPPPAIPLPTSLSLDDAAFICPLPTRTSNTSSTITSCCIPNPAFNATTNATNLLPSFLPRGSGDVTIVYDIIQSYQTSYLALVTIENHNPLGRLDNWRLSWEWMREEFIYSMKGAYPSLVDPSGCIYGPQGTYYQSLDFSQVLNCEKRPTLLDLPLSMTNDTNLGRIPFCCRNGTILPPSMDPSQSKSAFQIQVYKMPPALNRTTLYPPQSWKISGVGLTPDYQCGPPVRVSPTLFPDPSGLESNSSAIASWQVVCNVTQPKGSRPKCCVSFSGFYNESVVPCKTCACGCPASRPGPTCNVTAPAMLLPPEALLVPFDNRTSTALAWAELKHYPVPNPMPCPDNCGVSINWHVNTDYTKGWTARITLFNWGDENFANWFAAVELDKAYAGFEAMYSFNGTAMGNNTIFMQGLPGLNYLVGETNGTKPTDPRVPGKQQSVISFTKKKTPGINVEAGAGFPSKVIFNGEECSLPEFIPLSHGSRSAVAGVLSLVLVLVASTLVLLEL